MALETGILNVSDLLDAYWVSRLGPAALAAVTLGIAVRWPVNSLSMGLGIGGMAVVARRVGAGDREAADHAAGQTLLLGLAASLLLMAGGLALARPLLLLFGARPDVLPLGLIYLRVSVLGLFTWVPVYVNNALIRGAGEARLARTGAGGHRVGARPGERGQRTVVRDVVPARPVETAPAVGGEGAEIVGPSEIDPLDLWRTVSPRPRPADRAPDFSRLERALAGREAGPVPCGDLFADYGAIARFLGRPIPARWGPDRDPGAPITAAAFRDGLIFADQCIDFCLAHGWDYVFAFSAIPFAGAMFRPAPAQGGGRYWIDDNRGPIGTWDEFRRYPWPEDVRPINFLPRVAARRVPAGMKVMVIPGGVFEWTTWLMGLVPFCYALADRPGLVDAVIDRVAGTIYTVVRDVIDEPGVGGIFMGDDLGYASGTIVSPKILRQKFLPHTRRIVDLARGAGKLFILHTCGNVYAIMDDLIDLGIHAKHSFEDKILPVEEVYRRWGSRLGLVGGVDVHLLASGSEAQVRRRTRDILDVCGAGGGYVLGTGNSVADYIPPANYQAMLDEGRRWNRERFPGGG